MGKNNEPITNYRKKWIDFKKTDTYKRISENLKDKNITQPYRDNIMQEVFAAGWWAADGKIKYLNP